MEKVAETFKKEFVEVVTELPDELTPQSIRVLADIASIMTAACHLSEAGPLKAEAVPQTAVWKDDIQDEMDSAEEKYRQYRQSEDPSMLEMARDELRHAAYYLNHAKMSPDMKLKERLPEYQDRYDKLEMKIKAPHGNEKLPDL
jgi:hypothetical protein